MPWNVKGVVEQRVEFVERALNEGNFSALCREYGISRPTGYLWVRRYDESGTVRALADRSRRPKRNPTRTAESIEQRVVALHRLDGWGPKKVQYLLGKEGIQLPLITVRRIFSRHQLSCSRSVPGPAPQRFERPAPNDLWQMDYKGQLRTDDGKWCHPLAMLDDHSRFCVGLFALPNQQGAPTERCIIKSFETYGIPSEMLMDHGTPWWSSSNGWGLTKLSVNLINQGIALRFGRVRHPQTQGKVERFNRSLLDSLFFHYGGQLPSIKACSPIFDEFSERYNHVRPHESLGMQPPSTRYRRSSREYNPKPKQWEYPTGSIVIPVDTLGRITYNQRRYFVCEALHDSHVRVLPLEQSALVIYRNMALRELDTDCGSSVSVAFPYDA